MNSYFRFLLFLATVVLAHGLVTPLLTPRWPPAPPVAPCTLDSECDDSIVETTDFCHEGVCFNVGNSGYCTRDRDCEDWNPCTIRSCNEHTNDCSTTVIPDCCQNVFDCVNPSWPIASLDWCSSVHCIENQCISGFPIEDCCWNDTMCPTDTCYDGTCNFNNFECTLKIGNAGCECEDRAECMLGNTTDPDFLIDRYVDCVDGVCTNVSVTLVPKNCSNDTECFDGDCCTLDSCDHGQCHNVPVNERCECCQPTDCPWFSVDSIFEFHPDCVIRDCILGQCALSLDPDCCYTDEQCTQYVVPEGYENRCNTERHLCEMERVYECFTHSDCHQSSEHPCLQAACNEEVGICVYEAIPGCCLSDAWCDDGEVCTEDICLEETHECLNMPIYLCCHNDSQCPLNTNCTVWNCDHSVCHSHDIPNCCENDTECDDQNWCTIDYCLHPQHHCEYVLVENCCYTDSDCIDSNVCTHDYCVYPDPPVEPIPVELWKVCTHPPVIADPPCCEDVSDCTQGSEHGCSIDTCSVQHRCHYASNVSAQHELCCYEDEDCEIDNVCLNYWCHSRKFECRYSWIEDCCLNDSDCQTNWCNQTTCNVTSNQCDLPYHYPCNESSDPTCYVVICDELLEQCLEFSRCSHPDPCVNATCHPNGEDCIFTPLTCPDDHNNCTNDECTPGYGCLYQPLPCESDDDPCTDDYCNPRNGECLHIPKNCSDGNLCTVDWCDQLGDCLHEPIICDLPSDACTIRECQNSTGNCTEIPVDCGASYPPNVCVEWACELPGGCVALVALDCNDQNPCTDDLCDPVVGCLHFPIMCPSLSCAYGQCHPGTGQCLFVDACPPTGDECLIGYCDPILDSCINQSRICLPLDECDDPYCDSQVGCVSSPLDCSLGDPCFVYDCVVPVGCTQTPLNCSDGNVCTVDSCIEGECFHEEVLDCSYLNNTCNIGACVSEGGCVAVPRDCSDGLYCTQNLCEPVFGIGCHNPPEECAILPDQLCLEGICDEQSFGCVYHEITCPIGTTCLPGVCYNHTGCIFEPLDCSDGDLCTNDMCSDSQGGCYWTEVNCNDHKRCTLDYCEPLVGCVHDPIPGCVERGKGLLVPVVVTTAVCSTAILVCCCGLFCIYGPWRRRKRKD